MQHVNGITKTNRGHRPVAASIEIFDQLNYARSNSLERFRGRRMLSQLRQILFVTKRILDGRRKVPVILVTLADSVERANLAAHTEYE